MIHIFTICPILLFVLIALTPTASAAINVTAGTPVTLTWDASPTATSYILYERRATGNVVLHQTTSLIAPLGAITAGTHTYVVTASNATGESAPSVPLVVIADPPVVPVPPTMVTNFTGVLANGNLTLTWDARPTNEAVIGYTVYEMRGTQQISAITVNGLATTITGITPGVHSYAVAARNVTGEGPKSVLFTIDVIPPLELPGAPANLRAVP